MALLIRKIFSSLSFMIGLVVILSWFYWADSPFLLLLLGLVLLLLGIIGVVTTIAKAEEASD
jgi:hypothetical protein